MKISATVFIFLACSHAVLAFGAEPLNRTDATFESQELIPVGQGVSGRDVEVRLWTLADGRQASAKLIHRIGDVAVLEGANQNRVRVPIGEFSVADITYIDLAIPSNDSREVSSESDVIAKTLVVFQSSPLVAIENSLDPLDQVSGADLVATLQGQSLKTVSISYTVAVPVTEIQTVMQERFVRRCIRGRWVCVREIVPVPKMNGMETTAMNFFRSMNLELDVV
ncbi:MAG: hypothetical protein KDB00_28615 [Planctomycetales bacterium]|nr:hypothetical protein [Planctomycetales bacterium]